MHIFLLVLWGGAAATAIHLCHRHRELDDWVPALAWTQCALWIVDLVIALVVLWGNKGLPDDLHGFWMLIRAAGIVGAPIAGVVLTRLAMRHAQEPAASCLAWSSISAWLWFGAGITGLPIA